MTVKNLENRIKKIRIKIRKGNFKSGEESKLHFLKDNLDRILNGLKKLELELKITLENYK